MRNVAILGGMPGTDQYESWRAEIRRRREAAELNYRQAAAQADISDQRWRNLERGYEMRAGQQLAANPSRATVIAMAHAQGWETSKALAAAGFEPATEQELAPPSADPLARIQAVWSKLPVHQRELIALLVESMANPAAPIRRNTDQAGGPGRSSGMVVIQDVTPGAGTAETGESPTRGRPRNG